MPFSKEIIKPPLISVIVPCFNQARYLAEALNSVLAQTYPYWECIIVNDGSNDDTEILASNFASFDTRFQYVSKTNGGLSSARNKGLQYVTGKWIQFLDADDAIEPTKFEKHVCQIQKLDSISNTISYCDYKYGQENNLHIELEGHIDCQFKTSRYFEELIIRWESDLSIPCHCFLFHSTFFLNSGITFDESLPNHEDFDCWLKIFRLNPEVKYLDEKLCIYRIAKNSMSKNMKSMGEGFLQLLNKHIQFHDYSLERKKLLQKKRRQVLIKYNRFDQMSVIEKIITFKAISSYYYKRALQKAGLVC